MNKNPDKNQYATALIKFFSNEEHYLKFKSGSSLFRTPHFFRKNDNPGRGDRRESCLGYWDKNLGHELPNIIINGSPINIKDAQSILIYPEHEQHDAWIQSWAVIGPYNGFEHSLERMLQDFGAYFVIIPSSKISDYAQLLSEASGLQVNYCLVKYSDNPLERSLTVKDSKFDYQKEFRFFIGECPKDETCEKPLQLKGIDNILLKANSLEFGSPSGEKKWCSLGSQKVVMKN